ncbi:MAG: hypothetical protein ACO3KD_05000 [Gaiellales bacterium]
MPRTSIRGALAGVAAVAALAAVPAAQAYEGDWRIAGSFERTTSPSFYGGFNPNDVDEVDAVFDNRAKTLSVRLAYFQTPERGNVYVNFGRGQADGSCQTGVMDVSIATRDIVGPSRTEYAWTYSRYTPPEGEGWTYVGRFSAQGYWRYQWSRIVSGLDTEHYERVATLELDQVDGALTDVERLDNGATEMRWSFGSPLLNGIEADCLEIQVPGRRAPFTIAPPATEEPAPEPETDPEITSADDEMTLDDVIVSAGRRGRSIVLRMTGDAEKVQIRVRRGSKRVAFRNRIVLRNQSASVRSVMVRFSDGVEWSDWERVRVR